VPTNSLYFGVYNSNIATPSTNPAEYVWREVAGGFGTTKDIYYSSIGGRQIQFAAANTAPSSNFVISVANVAIDLDVITTAAGLPGERGPVVMAAVLTTADPTTASPSTLTGWFSSSRSSLTPPVGTGLTPVVGDTALFTYPVSGVSAAYEYNGSVWVSVTGQVISGRTIVDNTLNGVAVIDDTLNGSAVVVNSLAGTKLIFSSVTGDKIVANTITGNTIQVGTLTGNLIAANTITGNTIQVGTLTGNLIAANTITSNNIAANTIVANNIAGGTITADKLAANVLIANTVVSTGATIGNFASPGFWLQGSTGNARFGNTVSIGNSLTIGNNASIGGNLTVSGLISSGGLVANTVDTTQVVTSAISNFGFNQRTATQTIYSGTAPPSGNVIATSLNAVYNGQPVYIWPAIQWVWTTSTSAVRNLSFTLQATDSRDPSSWFDLYTVVVAMTTPYVIGSGPTYGGILTMPPYVASMYYGGPGSATNFYRIFISSTGGGGTSQTFQSYYTSILCQGMKR
jgi:hypothetical protein